MKKFTFILALALLVGLTQAQVQAQNYPTNPFDYMPQTPQPVQITQTNVQTTQYTPPCVALTTTLRMGNRDSRYNSTQGQVASLQLFLYTTGYLKIAPTGYFGWSTHKALKAFQRAYGIPPTGMTNQATRSKIQSIGCGTDPVASQGITIQLLTNQSDLRSGGSAVFSWTLNYPISNAGRSFYAYIKNAQGNIIGYKSIGASPTGTDSILIPANTPSGSYTLALIDQTDYQNPITSNVISLQVGAMQSSGVTITAPNGGESIAANTWFRLTGTMPSDRAYSVHYILMPQGNTPIRSGNGTAYISGTGGYHLGGYRLNYTSSAINTEVHMPADMPSGTYKLRVVLTLTDTPQDSYTPSNTYAYDDSNSVFTVTNPNSNTDNISVQLLTPSAIYAAGGSVGFSWTAPSNAGPLYAYMQSSTGQTITSRYLTTYGAGDASMSIPTNTANGLYRIIVVNQNNTTMFGQSAEFRVGGDVTTNTLRVTTPNGGERIEMNRDYRIEWQSPTGNNTIAGVNIELIAVPNCPYGYVCTTYVPQPYRLATNIANQGYFNWRVDPTFAGQNFTAGQYKIQVSGVNTSQTDISDNAFEIVGQTAATIRVNTANTDGTQWQFGSDYRIDWNTTGLAADRQLSISLQSSDGVICQIGYAREDARYFMARLTANQQCLNTGSYVSRLTAGYYRIHVSTSLNPSASVVMDTSDAYIRLIQNNLSVDITAPYEGTQWRLGSTQTVQFTASNLPTGAWGVISISGANGGGTLRTFEIGNSRSTDVSLTHIIMGDVIDNLRAGNYSLSLSVYDKAPCLGLCSPTWVPATYLGGDTIGYINIY